ncbi:zinc finger, CCHC-type containing protein [Tanacetum coccineum]
MAGNMVKDMTMNFRKLDKFEGHDFRRWQKKMHVLLTTLKVVYVLTTPMPELMEDAIVEAIRIRAKWENDDYICRGHILNGMFDSLFDVYTNVESAMELWDSLESKYMASKKFLLPPSWKDFKHTLKHGKDDLSLVQLGSHLRIEESLRAQESDKGKGKEVVGPSCGKTGHFKRDCRSGNKKNNASASGSGGIVIVETRRITQVLVVREKGLRTNPKTKVDAIAWWIDSGATIHICKDRCWFKSFEPVENGSVLYMGDDHFTPVHGKGSVVLEFISGKSITLFNVLYVPKLYKNLMSSPVLNKCGYKQVYEPDKYILSKSGVFVGFGYYNNGMFMLNLNKVPDDSGCNKKYVVTFIDDASRFCYVLLHAKDEALDKFRIYKTEVELLQNDLIKTLRTDRGGEYYDPVFFQSVGINHETTAPYTPQQNGVVERKNRARKKMVNSMLSYSGLSDGFWGEAIAILRLLDPKRKTSGEKGVDCIFEGNAEHSNAYRFYVIEPNDFVSIKTIIESRDAIFDENRFSLIPRPKDIIPNSDESQRDDHSNDVPSETPEPRKGKELGKLNHMVLIFHRRKVKSYGKLINIV